MKTILTTILIIIISKIILAQNFFPFEIGNKYQMRDDWWFHGPGNYYDEGTEFYPISVVGDSIINGINFNKVQQDYTYGPFSEVSYFYYDTLNQKLLIYVPSIDEIKLAIDFNAPIDSIYASWLRNEENDITSKGLTFETVFGDSHLVHSFEFASPAPSVTHHFISLAEDFGVFKYSTLDYAMYGGGSTHQVISSIIDSVIFNPIILQIDSLYPIKDRPIDTFPFILSMKYQATEYYLLDSLYFQVQYTRGDSILQSYQYNFPSGNHVSIYYPDLEVEDLIKCKAVINDYSIFHNHVEFPDTGWAVIKVLPAITDVGDKISNITFKLDQNFPNPFNPITTINYSIGGGQFVSIKVYDVLGNEVAKLVNEFKRRGNYTIEFDASKLSSGVYYYQLKAGEFIQTKKMIFLE